MKTFIFLFTFVLNFVTPISSFAQTEAIAPPFASLQMFGLETFPNGLSQLEEHSYGYKADAFTAWGSIFATLPEATNLYRNEDSEGLRARLFLMILVAPIAEEISSPFINARLAPLYAASLAYHAERFHYHYLGDFKAEPLLAQIALRSLQISLAACKDFLNDDQLDDYKKIVGAIGRASALAASGTAGPAYQALIAELKSPSTKNLIQNLSDLPRTESFGILSQTLVMWLTR
jgi:hypothetical protein